MVVCGPEGTLVRASAPLRRKSETALAGCRGWNATGRAIAGAVAPCSLVVVKGATGSGTRLPAFFSRRRGAELGEGNQVRVCGAWDGRVSGRRGLDFPVIWDRAGGPRWSVARAFLPGGFFKSSSSQVSAAGRFRREIEIRGSRCVIHGRARFLPRALREIGNWVAHKARGPTSVALQSRENELSFLALAAGRGQLVGGGTRARLHGAAARRDPKYLD